MSVAEALLRLADGDTDGAVQRCRRTPSKLAAHLADHLTKPAGAGVYVDPDAFERFISGGSNVDLYAATIDAVANVNTRRRPESLLDIGCGDGRITAATVPASCTRLQLVEPSGSMLETAVERVGSSVRELHTSSSTLQDFLIEQPDGSWDAAQSTFALHNLSPDARRDTLPKLASRVGSLSVVEFDVPEFVDRARDHATYASDAYERGIAEYDDDPMVIDGFLMPVLIGQFAPDQPRHTYEQSATAWADELVAAGFDSVSTTRVAGYWWADAVLVHATRNAPPLDRSERDADAVRREFDSS